MGFITQNKLTMCKFRHQRPFKNTHFPFPFRCMSRSFIPQCVYVLLCVVSVSARVGELRLSECNEHCARPADRTALACLLATRPGACGRLLPFSVRAPVIPPGWSEGTFMCDAYLRARLLLYLFFSSSLASPSALLRQCCWGVNARERPCCRCASVQIPVHSLPNGNGSLKHGRLERVESQ